jgi:hypothetical protein
MKMRVIYRTCPTCGRRFGQPDDPGQRVRLTGNGPRPMAGLASNHFRGA